ncbi:hypothetical protein L579_2933 [Pantoea sp. AS-PWVM4]|nr:hypothetical protein L579_2933 [Pantoea sp. AS-PWVM4]
MPAAARFSGGKFFKIFIYSMRFNCIADLNKRALSAQRGCTPPAR